MCENTTDCVVKPCYPLSTTIGTEGLVNLNSVVWLNLHGTVSGLTVLYLNGFENVLVSTQVANFYGVLIVVFSLYIETTAKAHK